MAKSTKSITALIAVIFIQLTIALLFFHPYLIEWGTTENETKSPFPGDNYAETVRSTRAINIHKPQSEIWDYLAALGADRDGFYSYILLEYLSGCKVEEQPASKKYALNLGRFVPIKSADSSGSYAVGFKVVEIEQGQSFVLEGWGDFIIKKINDNTSRLIIRTHDDAANNLIDKLGYSLFDILHYIMEKRMMLGIKDLVESGGKNYTDTTDSIWLLSIIFTGLIGTMTIFTSKNAFKIITPVIILSTMQYFVLVLNPKPYLGLILVAGTLSVIFLLRNKQHP